MKTLLENLTEYRRALYVYRAVSENNPKLGMKEPAPCTFGLCCGEGRIAALHVKQEVLGQKSLENPTETSKAKP